MADWTHEQKVESFMSVDANNMTIVAVPVSTYQAVQAEIQRLKAQLERANTLCRAAFDLIGKTPNAAFGTAY